ncbi:tail fiber domain-containing protein, partial [Microcoleus sp. B9-D4]|uniref:tail fiber domain-containing protein n=1 Tax=Microcoleus sp. B9-D4 TaxID=2818711 RepID=UPI002FD06381
TQTEGDGRYRQTATALTDADIPAAIARDTEVTTAVNNHVAATNPHAQYLTQTEGDGRYRLASTTFFAAPLPTASVAGNSIAFSWNSVQSGLGIAELCNYAGLGGGDAFNFFRMPGSANSTPTLSNRVSRIDITGGYIQTSDRKVKSDFSPAPGLSAILALLPQKYKHWECTGFDTEKRIKLGKHFASKVGFVAQEVQKVLPEAVAATKSKEELYGIDYSCIVACVVRALQELHEQVSELRDQLDKIAS